MLRLPDTWIWDSWVADDGERYHLFFLQAPSSLADPVLRHTAASIGHATSLDLRTWERQPDALAPAAGRWDDLALWTGSVVPGDDGVWRMFYTAINTRGRARDQRIGLAESDDLVTWRRHGDQPLLSVDTRWYTSLDDDPGSSETWRDPFVFPDPDGDGWHMLITARARGAAPHDDGVLGHARSADLRSWEVGPPLSAPGAGFGQLEVPQVREVDGRQVLVFTCAPQEQTAERVARSGAFCTWSLAGDSPLGPWDLDRAVPLTAEPALFAAPLVQQRDGRWALLGFRNLEDQGRHALEIVDPVPVHLAGDGLVADSGYPPSPPAG